MKIRLIGGILAVLATAAFVVVYAVSGGKSTHEQSQDREPGKVQIFEGNMIVRDLSIRDGRYYLTLEDGREALVAKEAVRALSEIAIPARIKFRYTTTDGPIEILSLERVRIIPPSFEGSSCNCSHSDY